MSNTHAQLIACGAENCHPKYIGTVDGVREVLATAVDGTIYLTEAGKKFLADSDAPAKPGRKAKAKGTQEAAVEPVTDESTLTDDLDMEV